MSLFTQNYLYSGIMVKILIFQERLFVLFSKYFVFPTIPIISTFDFKKKYIVYIVYKKSRFVFQELPKPITSNLLYCLCWILLLLEYVRNLERLQKNIYILSNELENKFAKKKIVPNLQSTCGYALLPNLISADMKA